MTTANDPSEHEYTAAALAEVTAVEVRVDRMCRVFEKHKQSNPDLASDAYQFSTIEIYNAKRQVEEARKELLPEHKFIDQESEKAINMATRRLAAITNEPSSIKDTDDINPVVWECLQQIADAAQLQHHKTQIENTPNPTAEKAHIFAANIVFARIAPRAPIMMHEEAREEISNAASPEIAQQIEQSFSEAALNFQIIQTSRRRALPVKVSEGLKKANQEASVTKAANEFKMTEEVIALSLMSTGNTLDGNEIKQLVIMYEFEEQIMCQMLGEPYPAGMTQQEVAEHAQLIMEYVESAVDHEEQIDIRIAQSLMEASNYTQQMAASGLHSVSVDKIKEAVNLLPEESDPALVQEALHAVCNGIPEIASFIGTNNDRTKMATQQQAEAIIKKAIEVKVSPGVAIRIAQALKTDADQYKLTSTPIKSADTELTAQALKEAGVPVQNTFNFIAILTKDIRNTHRVCTEIGYEDVPGIPQGMESIQA